MCTSGTALLPSGQVPVFLSGNVMWVRWLALSVLVPSQQLGSTRMRWTWLPRGHSGYFVVSRLPNPVQVHWARALAGPLVVALASPVMILMKRGMATTLLVALP